MSFDVDRFDDGYRLTLRPPLEPEELVLSALSRAAVELELRSRDVHIRDVLDAFDSADWQFRRGTSERIVAVREAWHRAHDGRTGEDDIELLRAELDSRDLDVRQTYLINALYMAGEKDDALVRIREVLCRTESQDDHNLALRFLAEWAPTLYEREVTPLFRGEVEDRFHDLSWALTYAGALLRDGLAPALLDELERVARQPGQDPNTRRHARAALATAVGYDLQSPEMEHLWLHASDADVAQVVDKIRERLSSAGG